MFINSKIDNRMSEIIHTLGLNDREKIASLSPILFSYYDLISIISSVSCFTTIEKVQMT